jgi:hypothetical protein
VIHLLLRTVAHIRISGGTDVWCNESATNCGQYNGFFIYPSEQVGCFAMWVSCQQTSQCCGKAQCLMSADGWQHCNLPSNLLTTKPAMAPTAAPTPAPTVKVPTKPPTRRSDPSACQSAHRILPTVAPAPTAAPAPAPINPVTKSPTTTPTPRTLSTQVLSSHLRIRCLQGQWAE